jgi:hypothetical protein
MKANLLSFRGAIRNDALSRLCIHILFENSNITNSDFSCHTVILRNQDICNHYSFNTIMRSYSANGILRTE